MKVFVNADTCQNMGQCAFEAPELFSLDAQGRLLYEHEADDTLRDQVAMAAELCPTQSIRVE